VHTISSLISGRPCERSSAWVDRWMSLRTAVEIALHFESFRNIDLFHQGLYHLKTRLYRNDGDQRLFAIPYGHFTCPVQLEQPKPKPTRTDHHHLIPAHIIEDQYTFSTRSFLIRYCEEEVELNDIGQFRIEFGPGEAEQSAPLLLEVDLMFADLTQHGGADRFGEQPDVDSTEFKSVSTQMFRVHRSDQGLHEFSPIVFDEFHFCLVNIVIHSVLLDIKLRLRPLLPVPTRPKQEKKSTQGGEGSNDVQIASVPTTQNTALSLAECVFGGIRGEGRERLLDLTEVLYQEYLGNLAASYSKLAEWFKEIVKKCLTSGQREVFGEAIEVPEMQLPNGMPVPFPPGKKTTNGHSTPLRSYLSAKLGTNVTQQTISMHLAYDMNAASCQIMDIWHKVLNVLSYSYREITAFLRMSWERRVPSQWSSLILKESVTDVPEGKARWENHTDVADNLRKSSKMKALDNVVVEDMSLISKMEQHPIVFEQKVLRSHGPKQTPEADDCVPSAPKPYRGVHLFVLVHGYQGNSFDMRLFKDNIALLFPDAIFLCANSNEDNTDGCMNEMGIRLAQEVVNYICDWCPGSALGRLSFVSQSIGGIIVRAALPLLHEYHAKLFTFISSGTPHLGFFKNTMTPFAVGYRFYKRYLKKETFLEQIGMWDSTDPRETFLYRLSTYKGLEFFQNIVLICSAQDEYSDLASARIEASYLQEDMPKKDVYKSMVNNVWDPVRPERVMRLKFNFYFAEKGFDNMIGRAAHIQFLENQAFMKMIIHNYSFLFR